MNRQENILEFPIIRDAKFALIDTNYKVDGAYKAKGDAHPSRFRAGSENQRLSSGPKIRARFQVCFDGLLARTAERWEPSE